MFKKSNNPKVEEMTKSYKDRSCNLDSLQVIKNENGKFCTWCVENKLKHGNQKYCSRICNENAKAWAYPQKEDSLKYLLYRQQWKCADCQYDYRPFLETYVIEDRKYYGAYSTETISLEVNDEHLLKLFWYHFKRLKEKVPQDKKPEVDHIIPIHKGGQSLGNENHQVICFMCHKKKTSKDLSGKKVK